MKLCKTGVDGIFEMIKGLGEKATEEFVQICQQIYTSSVWPVDFNHASKIMKVLTQRIEA